MLRFGQFTLDLDRGELRRLGAQIDLRPKTFGLLCHLCAHQGKLLTKEELLTALWPGLVVSDDSLSQCVNELRKALDDRAQELIKTLPRRGYLFDVDVQEVLPASTAAFARPPSLGPPSDRARSKLPWRARAAICLALIGSLAMTVWAISSMRSDTLLSGRRSIAVLPFFDLSDEKHAFFGEGVAADLTDALARVPDTLVIAEGSAAAAAAIDPDPRMVGRALSVHYVVTGSLRRDGNAVTMRIQFIDASDGVALWNERYDYAEVVDWRWQRDVASRIAGTLRTRLMVAEAKAPLSQSSNAIDEVMQGRAIEARSTRKEDVLSARAHFEAALRSDPDSVAALSGLAYSHAQQVGARWSWDRTAQMALAEKLISRALDIDPNYAPAHQARGNLQYSQGDIEGALRSYKRVVELNPSDAGAHARIGLMLFTLGRPGEVAPHADLAIRLDPLSPQTTSEANAFAGIAQFQMQHDAAAYERLRTATEIDPTMASAFLWMAAIDGLHERAEDARSNLAMFYRLRPNLKTYADLVASQPPRSSMPGLIPVGERRRQGLQKAGMPGAEVKPPGVDQVIAAMEKR